MASATKVVTDDGLGRLGNGIAYHKEEGRIVAGNAEGSYTIVTQIVHKGEVACECKYCQREFS